VGAGRRVDELASDAHSLPRAADAAFKYVADAEFSSNLAYIHRLAFVGEARIAGDDEKLREARQLRDDVLSDSVAEVVLLWIPAEVRKGEDGDRGPVG
jgi:hypothetical protein